jgi:hypothetical protein
MYGRITMQAVYKIMTAFHGNRRILVRGVSVKRTQMERNATEKKWETRMKGCLMRPASKPTGPPIGPTWK